VLKKKPTGTGHKVFRSVLQVYTVRPLKNPSKGLIKRIRWIKSIQK